MNPKNHVMLMAKFIHSHPELQMQTPRVWRTHYEDEYQQDNKIRSFTALRRYSSLVRIHKLGRNYLYGSAKIPAKVIANQLLPQLKTETKTKSKRSPKTSKGCQLELDYSPESVMEEIENIMLSASQQIQDVLRNSQNKEFRQQKKQH